MKIRAFQVTPGMLIQWNGSPRTVESVERADAGRTVFYVECHPDPIRVDLCAADMVVEIDPDRDPASAPADESFADTGECLECDNSFDDNPGKRICMTCEDWEVV